jgi:hypothetical protein
MSDETATPKPSDEPDPASPELVKQLASIYARLLATGSARIRIDYSAREGTGGFMIQAFNAAGQCVTEGVDTRLCAELATFFVRLLEMRHPGWHQGPGAQGHIEWDLAINRLKHRHRQRIENAVTFNHLGL